MNHQEAVILTRYTKACCPQQAIDEYTPDAWFDLLGDLDLEDCKQAVARVAKVQPFVAPAEIRAEVRRLRESRIPEVAHLPLPSGEVADNGRSYAEALQHIVNRLADGRMPFHAIRGGKRDGDEPSEEFKRARSQEDRDRVLSRTVACPVEWCPALPGEPCRSSSTAAPLEKWHPSRLQAALGAEGEAS